MFASFGKRLKTQLLVEHSVKSETDLKAISQYLQANVKTYPLREAEYPKWIYSVRKVSTKGTCRKWSIRARMETWVQ